jgi:hypothetical protein
MLKKLFITAAAAAAVSVPLAGVAWAEPSPDNNPPGQGATGPGVPHELGGYLDSLGANPLGADEPVPPGRLFNIAKDGFKTDPDTGKNIPGVSTPDAVGAFVDTVYGSDFGVDGVAPGLATKTLTPGCKSGHTATAPNGNHGPGVCH